MKRDYVVLIMNIQSTFKINIKKIFIDDLLIINRFMLE